MGLEPVLSGVALVDAAGRLRGGQARCTQRNAESQARPSEVPAIACPPPLSREKDIMGPPSSAATEASCGSRARRSSPPEPADRDDAASHWGDGTTSASDGQRFAMPQKVLQRTYSTRFNDFALEFVADNYAPFYSRPIECTDRDAPFVLDGVLYHESDLDLEEHYTDTHGYTEINFAVAGVQGDPRGGAAVQPVLRAVPGLGREARPGDAPGAPRRREAVRRLRRADGAGGRPRNRRGAAGADLRGRARRLELHLRRGDVDADPAGLDGVARARLRILRRVPRAGGTICARGSAAPIATSRT